MGKAILAAIVTVIVGVRMSFRGTKAPWESPGTQYRFAV